MEAVFTLEGDRRISRDDHLIPFLQVKVFHLLDFRAGVRGFLFCRTAGAEGQTEAADEKYAAEDSQGAQSHGRPEYEGARKMSTSRREKKTRLPAEHPRVLMAGCHRR
jgi:hypothetical protein